MIGGSTCEDERGVNTIQLGHPDLINGGMRMTGPRNRMMTTSAVARTLNVHLNTVRRWSNQGILKPYRIGTRRDRRFARDDINAFLSENKG